MLMVIKMKNEIIFSYRENGLYLHHTLTTNPTINHLSFQSHSHNMYEIYLFLKGDGDFAVEGNVIPLERGVLVFTLSGQLHNLLLKNNLKNYERIAILFNEKMLPEGADEIINLASKGGCVAKLDEAGLNWFLEGFKILKSGEKNGMNIKLLSQSFINLILTKMLEISEEAKVYDDAPEDALVKQIIRYIDRHLGEELSLDVIEKALYRDKAYLGRRFKEVMGCSIWEYIMRKRIFAARQQLYLTKSVLDAFTTSGFGDYSTFYRRYKKYVGLSPKEDLKQINE